MVTICGYYTNFAWLLYMFELLQSVKLTGRDINAYRCAHGIDNDAVRDRDSLGGQPNFVDCIAALEFNIKVI